MTGRGKIGLGYERRQAFARYSWPSPDFVWIQLLFYEYKSSQAVKRIEDFLK
jgi:hypothetical protein